MITRTELKCLTGLLLRVNTFRQEGAAPCRQFVLFRRWWLSLGLKAVERLPLLPSCILALSLPLAYVLRQAREREARLIAVRRMGSEDIAGTAALFQEMQAHYRVACPPLDEITARLAKLPGGISVLVAAYLSVIGFAAMGVLFPGPGLMPGLFLKELFVSAGARGSGAGTALMRAAARLAVDRPGLACRH